MPTLTDYDKKMAEVIMIQMVYEINSRKTLLLTSIIIQTFENPLPTFDEEAKNVITFGEVLDEIKNVLYSASSFSNFAEWAIGFKVTNENLALARTTLQSKCLEAGQRIFYSEFEKAI